MALAATQLLHRQQDLLLILRRPTILHGLLQEALAQHDAGEPSLAGVLVVLQAEQQYFTDWLGCLGDANPLAWSSAAEQAIQHAWGLLPHVLFGTLQGCQLSTTEAPLLLWVVGHLVWRLLTLHTGNWGLHLPHKRCPVQTSRAGKTQAVAP